MEKKLYIIEGTFSAITEGTSEEDAKASFDPLDIDSYSILSVEEEEDND